MNLLVYEISKAHQSYWDLSIADKSLNAQDIELASRVIPNFSRFSYELFGLLLNSASPIESRESDSIWAEEVINQVASHHQFGVLQALVNGSYLDAGYAMNAVVKVLSQGLLSDALKPDTTLANLAGLRSLLAIFPKGSEEYDSILQQGKDNKLAWEEYGCKLAESGELGILIDNAISDGIAAVEYQQNLRYAFDPSHLDADTEENPGEFDSKKRLSEIVDKSAKLKEVLELAGKLKKRAASKRKELSESLKHQIDDIGVGDDYSSIVSSEWCDPLVSVKLALGEFLTYKKTGEDTHTKGSLVLILDSTGSLGGYPEIWTKAVVLVIAAICEEEKRDFIVLHYGNGVVKEQVFKAGEDNSEALIECINFFQNDPVNNERPVFERAIQIIKSDEEFTKSDIVFITDGGCDWSGCRKDVMRKSDWFEWYTAQLDEYSISTYGVLIGGDAVQDELKAITENWVEIGRSPEQDEAIDKLWGI